MAAVALKMISPFTRVVNDGSHDEPVPGLPPRTRGALAMTYRALLCHE